MPYVSAKHFSISKQGSDVCLTDFSTNGTFLNNILIGKGNNIQIQNGDRISIKFQGEDQIVFEFNNNNKSTSVMPSEHTDILQMEIEALRQDKITQEKRISGYISQIEAANKNISLHMKEIRELSTIIEEKNTTIVELKQSVLELESNNAALQARIRNIEQTNQQLMKSNETLRNSLNESYEKISIQNESILKLQNANDTIEHLTNQYNNINNLYLKCNNQLIIESSNREKYEILNKELNDKLMNENISKNNVMLENGKLKERIDKCEGEIQKYQVSNCNNNSYMCICDVLLM